MAKATKREALGRNQYSSPQISAESKPIAL